jgi:hypothetical protein
MPPVALPAEIIARYANKTIAVTGFEVNVFRHNNITGEEDPVPAYQSYNHHYGPYIYSSYVKVKQDAYGNYMGHDGGHGKVLEFELMHDAPVPPPNVQLMQAFVHGNGQEHRQMYHGNPAGYIQSIYSPGWFILSPMQICTNDGTGAIGAKAPLPEYSRINAPPDARYSPLLECPCTTRIVKNSIGSIESRLEGQCPLALNETTCYQFAARALGYKFIHSNTTISNPNLPANCLISRVSVGQNIFNVAFNNYNASKTPCQGNGSYNPAKNHILGNRTDLVALSLEVDGINDIVTITMSGPSEYWYGVGFNASKMADQPYAIIVDGKGAVQERKLAYHDPGKEVLTSVKVVSNTVKDGLRTVVLQRPLIGPTQDHYNFSTSFATIPFINALGDTVELEQHKFRGASSILLFHTDATPSCVCSDGVKTIAGIPYDGDCKPEPLSDLLRDNNPTCEVSSYVGGLACCFDKQFLLDEDQTPPPFVDEIYFKFRFYFEDYNPALQQEIYHVEWSNNGCDSGGWPNPMACEHIEYDVVKGAGSIAGPDIQMFTSTFPAGGMLETTCGPTAGQCMDGSKVGPEGFKLMMAAAHCHAPNCIRQELFNMDTGELICLGIPKLGDGEEVFNEAGYLYFPPCLWGTAEEGLFPPPVFQKNTTLKMISYYNSTYGHPGQMGIWQMKGAYNL